jgi:hypothetical protein
VNVLGDNIGTIKKQTLIIDAGKKVGLEINVEKTMYMLLSHQQNAGPNHDTERANISLENMLQFKSLETTVTNQNFFQGEHKKRLHSDNACYRSVQFILSSRLLPKKHKFRMYTSIICLRFCMVEKLGF